VPLLILDDLGMRKLPTTAAEDLLELIMRRYERTSTLLTSNRPVDDWGRLLGDTAAVTAMLDRLRSWKANRRKSLRRPRMAGFQTSTEGGGRPVRRAPAETARLRMEVLESPSGLARPFRWSSVHLETRIGS
jgi:hypothetical protein